MEPLSDEQLITAYLTTGNEVLFQTLTDRYLKSVYNFIYRYVGNTGDAEDITQDVFVSAWEHLKNFDTSKKFSAWIFTIAKNTSLNWIKKKKPALFSAFQNEKGENVLEELLRDAGALPDALFEQAHLKGMLQSAIEKLPAHYRDVLFPRYYDDLTFQQIADRLGKPLDTVKSQHRRAILALKRVVALSLSPLAT
jgi:RNA polymerase sigma-70 factor (ECF subfamily)